MAHNLKELMHAWFREVWNNNRPEVIDQMIAPGMKLHGLGSQPMDAAAFKAFHRQFQAAFSDIRIDLPECLAEGDRSACVFIFRARHSGDALGIAATGREVSVMGIAVARWREGRLIEAYNQFDHAGMMQQINAS
jgi:predicted ester cyclase